MVAVNLIEKSAPGCNNLAQPGADPVIVMRAAVSHKPDVFVKRKCEQKGPKKVSTFSTRFHVVSNVFPKYQMLTF